MGKNLPTPHPRQREFIESPAKRKIIRAGRRGGKTIGAAIIAIRAFLSGRRVLYATPTAEQIDRFWATVTRVLYPLIDSGALVKNETRHVIGWPDGREARIRAKTAWNADTLRGDYADLLVLDEYQMMSEDAWEVVGAPMLLDNDGDAIFIYTPPSVLTAGAVKARDKMHAAKLYRRAAQDTSGRWAVFHFASHANPHISDTALREITSDMSALRYRQEIEAEDIDSVPGALWTMEKIEAARVVACPPLVRLVVGVDPSATSNEQSDEAGIVCAGVDAVGVAYVLSDVSRRGTPHEWASAAVAEYRARKAAVIVAEDNNGGEMVSLTIQSVDASAYVKRVHASRGKAARAEPISALYEQGRVRHVGYFPALEEEMVTWTPTSTARSPNRLDALVWALTELSIGGGIRYAL